MENKTLKDFAVETAANGVPPTIITAPPQPAMSATNAQPNMNQSSVTPVQGIVPVPVQLEDDINVHNAIDITDFGKSVNETDIQKLKANESYYIQTHRNNLIMIGGMDPLEANKRAVAMFNAYVSNDAIDTDETLEEVSHSNVIEASEVAEIIINKTDDIEKLELTEDEHSKIERVKKIRLISIEDVDLANIEIERPNEDIKMDYIKSIEGAVSRYSLPLPILGDYITMRGAQISQMLNLIKPDDAKLEEVITAKASLVYEKLLRGAILDKFSENGKIKMSYTEFTNILPYQDLDMAVYAILCASSIDESATEMKCDKCNHTYEQKYSIRGLLNMDDAPDAFKEKMETTLTHSTDSDRLKLIYNDNKKIKRYKSPFSNHIFDLSYPTVARANAIFKKIDQTDPVMTYTAAIALYVSRILIYNEATGKYIEVTSDETGSIIETIMTLHDKDIKLISNQVQEELMYIPKFIFKSACPVCQHEIENEIKIEHILFLKAQDSSAEMTN